MKNKFSLLFLFLTAFTLVFTGIASAQLPPLELKVKKIEGELTRENADGSLEKLTAGDTLGVGEKIKSSNGEAQLEIPGISLLKIDSGTELIARKMHRDTEIQGMLGGLISTGDEITVNEIDIETFQGQVINSIRSHKNVETDYQIITPTAVAGIRGTTFRCEILEDNSTEVSVLEGRVNFYNRFNPQFRREIQARQRSRLRQDEDEPDEPEEIEEDDEKEIKELKDLADNELLLAPALEKININNQTAAEKMQFVYTSQQEWLITGQASAREEDAELQAVNVSVNGKELEVSGLENWQTSFTPPLPEAGTTMEIEVNIQVTDNLGSTEEFKSVIELSHPHEKPELKIGDLKVTVTEVAGYPPSELTFPLQLIDHYLNDGNLLIGGSAESAEEEVAGVAVRFATDEGSLLDYLKKLPENEQQALRDGSLTISEIVNRPNSFLAARGSAEWIASLALPGMDEFELELQAWSDNNALSPAVRIGPFTSAQSAEIPPVGYREGSVDIRYTSVARQPLGELEFPFHSFRGDVEGEGVIVEGSVETEGNVAAVAYSLDGGSNWQLANGTDQWWFAVPATVGATYEVVTVAWTIDGMIGSQNNLGEIIHTAHSYEAELRQNYVDMWDAYEQQNARDFMYFLHDEFEFYDDWDRETLDRSEFERMIKEDFKETLSLSVNQNIERTMADMYSGELQGQFTFKTTRPARNDFYVEDFMQSDGTYGYERVANGEYKLLTIKDWDETNYDGFEISFFHTSNQLDGWEPEWFEITHNDPMGGEPYYYGQLIFILNYENNLNSPPSEPTVYVRDNNQSSETVLNETENPVSAGGVFATGRSNLSDISTIPSVTSPEYKNKVTLFEGEVYALNIKPNPNYYMYADDEDLNSNTGIFKVIGFNTGPLGIEEVKLRVILTETPPGGNPILNFEGVDPF